MVWFQCEDCGDNLKKPKLANHFRVCSANRVRTISSRNRASMATRGFVLYLLVGFSVAVFSVFIISDHQSHKNNHPPRRPSPNSVTLDSDEKTWPELEFDHRIVLATIIGFLGSAFGTVGGVGGGGIFVPMLTLIIGFDTKSAAALSNSGFYFSFRFLIPD